MLIVDAYVFRDDITIKVDGGGVAFTLGARDYKGVQCVSYQTVYYIQDEPTPKIGGALHLHLKQNEGDA